MVARMKFIANCDDNFLIDGVISSCQRFVWPHIATHCNALKRNVMRCNALHCMQYIETSLLSVNILYLFVRTMPEKTKTILGIWFGNVSGEEQSLCSNLYWLSR